MTKRWLSSFKNCKKCYVIKKNSRNFWLWKQPPRMPILSSLNIGKNYFNRNFENIKTEKLQTYILDSLIFSVWTASISFDSDSNLDTKNKKCFSDLNCITVRNHTAERENESTEMEYYQMWSILQTRTMLNFLSFDLRTFSWVLNTFAQTCQ